MKSRAGIPLLTLPVNKRPILSLPHGTLYVSNSGLVKGMEAYYAVGDYVSQTLNYSVNIIDFKTRRRQKIMPTINSPALHVFNPPGTLSINSRTILKGDSVRTIIVVGEEDLIPIAISLEKKDRSIAYGQPGVGVVITKADPLKGRRLLKILKPTILSPRNGPHSSDETLGLRPHN